jgi:hypothetical protein
VGEGSWVVVDGYILVVPSLHHDFVFGKESGVRNLVHLVTVPDGVMGIEVAHSQKVRRWCEVLKECVCCVSAARGVKVVKSDVEVLQVEFKAEK